MTRSTYHHGDLRAAILTEAARLVAERGADRVSLRELAREAGVSHAAPAHHVTDRRGLFTALAAQGCQLLAAALTAARPHFVDAALAYVRFAIEHMSDRVLRLDPKSGRSVEYLLPRETNLLKVFVDNTMTPVTFWAGNNHGASIVKLELLEEAPDDGAR